MAHPHIKAGVAFTAKVQRTKNRLIAIPAEAQRALELERQTNNHIILASIRVHARGRWNHHYFKLTQDNEFAVPADVTGIRPGNDVDVKIHRVIPDVAAVPVGRAASGAGILTALAQRQRMGWRSDGSRENRRVLARRRVMKRTVYVDTSWLIALIDRSDAHHQAALDLASALAKEGTPLVSCDAVVLELANYFARSPLRGEAIAWVEEMRAADGWDIVALDSALVARGESRYRRFDDKAWSLTDCVGMEIMRARGLRNAATTDHGFEQAGFVALLPSRSRR